LTALLCADPAALDGDYYRLLQAKDAAIRLVLQQIEADLAACPVSADESATAWALLVVFFSQLYRNGETTVSRLPEALDGIWLDWWYRGQHALGEGSCFRNYSCGVKTQAGEVAVRFSVAAAQAACAERGLLVPLTERVRYDSERLTLTLPFVSRVPTRNERARWGRGQAAQRGALQELFAPCVEALAEAGFPGQELLKHTRAFMALQWADLFLPVALGPLLEARLERFLLECADLSLDHLSAEAPVLDGRRRISYGVRTGARPLIDALARAAEPERRLYEKRPFVGRTDWLVPVMHVARSLWPTILANTTQLEAWRTMFDLTGQIDEGVLERHPTLVVDTRHFNEDDAFKQALLASFPDRDTALDGMLIHAENYRALRFLQPGYQGRVRAIVIDPPYGTGNRDYPYRDAFEHYSWLTMMEERLRLAWQLLDEEGVLFVHIDDHQMAYLGSLLDELCGEEKRVAIVVWHRIYGGHSDAKHISTVHEYILVYARNPARFYAGEEGAVAPDGRELLTHTLWNYTEVGSTATGTKELQAMLRDIRGEDAFPTVKPTRLIRRMLRLGTLASDRSSVLDFFGGSGSLAQALIDQNRADGGNRRFLLVEQSRHFELTILPRVMRAMYCPAWKDGRPVDYPEPGLWWPDWVDRTPRLVQVLHLEGYEESLENLSVGESAPATEPAIVGHALRYRVRLPLSSQGDLLEGEQFAHPFTSALTKVSERGVCSSAVDMVETFNALLGLHVERTCDHANPDTGRQYQAVSGRLEERRVLVLWSERPSGTTEDECPFLRERMASFDLVLTNDPEGAEGRESLAPLFRERMEGRN